ncbi:AAA family ATPase [Lacticaseibacillus hulanensis]|uniref:AAA family ATPase n=1 Tax=Lacticaseibacillus hulanensis TaxID=2493111 RepID=UPI000FDBD057|nr:AAA family ATPase [Lacticaseibacillus hulanensis]
MTAEEFICGNCGNRLTGEESFLVFSDCTLIYTQCTVCRQFVFLEVAAEVDNQKLRRKLFYSKAGDDMLTITYKINNRELPREVRMQAVKAMRMLFDNFAEDDSLSELTKIYLAAPSTNNPLGYDANEATKFIRAFHAMFRQDENVRSEINVDAATWLQQHRLDVTLTQASLADQSRINNPLLMLVADLSNNAKVNIPNLGGESMANEKNDDEKAALLGGPTTAAVMATTARMFNNYTDNSGQLINFARVTEEMVPQKPSLIEATAYSFFQNHPAAELVLPGPEGMQFFAEDSKKLQMILASDARATVVIATKSKLAYELFLTQVARDLATSPLPQLRNVSLLNVKTSTNYRFNPHLRYVMQMLPGNTGDDKLMAPKYESLRLMTGNDQPVNGRLYSIVKFPLSPLSVDLVAYMLHAYAPRYERHHNVAFTDKAITAIASGSRTILAKALDPEKALLLLDQVAAVCSPGTGKDVEKVIIDDDAVQNVFATQYHTFPTSVLDRGIVRGLEAKLNKQVIGQKDAVKSVAKAMARASLGFNNPNRPIASFLFVGPTGVGKTELAKQLALDLYGSETEYIKLDMSEFANPQDGIYKLIGGAPVWTGSKNGGKLTNALAAHPNAIVLFDEFEKASPDVHNLMLQVLDEGRITSGLGQVFSLKSNILIFTSNAGMESADVVAGFGQQNAETRYVFSKDKFEETFPKELLNRFSSIVEFQPLAKSSLNEIFAIKMRRYYNLLAKQGISLKLDSKAQQHIIDLGYNPDMGARPLERAIDDALISPIADLMLANDAVKTITVTVGKSGKLKLTADSGVPKPTTDAVLYVDGAYNPKTDTYAYGAVLTTKGKNTELAGAGHDKTKTGMRDYGPQLDGVLAGLHKAIEFGITEITIVYDYNGVEGWAARDWQANNPSSQAYKKEVLDLQKKIKLYFVHQGGASTGLKRRANQLAKNVVGLHG